MVLSSTYVSSQPKLIVVSGPSGVGKSTLVKALLSHFQAHYANSLKLSISHTTRASRQHETNAENYYFTSKEAFREMIEEGIFLEYANIYGNYYGTSKQFIAQSLQNRISVLLEIDVEGAEIIRKSDLDSCQIFIAPPDISELEHRIVSRGSESEEELVKRKLRWEYEIAQIEHYHHTLCNRDLSATTNELISLIEKEIQPISSGV